MKRISTGAMVALCTVALLSTGTHSRAQLASSLTSSTNGNISGYSVMAGQFSLTNAATVSSAVMSLTDLTSEFSPFPGPPGNLSDLTAYLYTDSGNTVGSSLASSTGVSGTFTASPSFSPITFTFGEPELSAGTYWLELQVGGSTSVGWAYNYPSITNTGTDGTVDSGLAFGPGNTFVNPVLFSINGDEVVSSTPEPGSIALLCGMGLTGSMLLLHRRKKSVPAK